VFRAFAPAGARFGVSDFSTRSAIDADRRIRRDISESFVRRAGWYGSRKRETT